MAIPAGVYHVVFGGPLVGGEQWESGFWVEGALPPDEGAANALAELWYGQMTDDDTSGGLVVFGTAFWSVDISVTYCKIYAYPTGGPSATIIGEHDPTPYAGTVARSVPNQCSLVISLRTGLAGRSHRGRMYLPIGTLDGGTLGQVPESTASNCGDIWAACFTDWNASGDNGTVVVMSSAKTSAAPITSVVVDTKVDIQRRRAMKQSATGSSGHPVTV
jgi:hypothetical protein